jgi:hypothetical protein
MEENGAGLDILHQLLLTGGTAFTPVTHDEESGLNRQSESRLWPISLEQQILK